MKANVSWAGNVKFVGEVNNHQVVMDGPEEFGGEDQGFRPMQLLLVGMGGCASFDVMTMLKKSRQNVTDCSAELDAERADAVPSVFTKIHIHFKVSGMDLKEAHVKRAVSLSAEKYCSASIMMAAAGVEVTHSYEIVE
jgi:putative redox protein